MTTTDTDALAEKIRDEVAGIVIGSGYYSTAIGVDEASEVAAAVLPIVADEVRKAKAEAWDETCEAFAWCITNGPIEDALPYVAEHNPYRSASR